MKILIVDGYNVINASDAGRELMRTDQEAARLALIHRLSEFAIAETIEVTVVFDAHQSVGATTEQQLDGVTVCYGSRRQSADHIIERLVYRLRERRERDIVVATNDRLIGDVVAPMGAVVITVSKLEEEMQHVRSGVHKRDGSTRAPRLEDGMDRTVRDRLERMRRGGI